MRDPLSDAIDNLMASAGAVLLVSLLSETRLRTVLILRLIRITTLVSGDARGRALDDLWTTGCSRQRRTTARRARSAIFTGTYTDVRTRLDRLTELLIDLNDLHNRCEPTERRILNRVLLTHITINAKENAAYTPTCLQPSSSRSQHRCSSESHDRNKTVPPGSWRDRPLRWWS